MKELERAHVQAQVKSYKAEVIEEHEYVACGKKDCCPVCKKLDGKIFKVKDMECGENAPPMHPNCHCATAPYLDRKEYDEWLDRYKDHSLTFEEWKKEGENHLPFFLNNQLFGDRYAELRLQKREYAKVVSEVNTWVKEKDVIKGSEYNKCIGDYIYTFIYNEFDDYTIVGKTKITAEDKRGL